MIEDVRIGAEPTATVSSATVLLSRPRIGIEGIARADGTAIDAVRRDRGGVAVLIIVMGLEPARYGRHSALAAGSGRPILCAAVATGTPATTVLTRARIPFVLHAYEHDPRAEAYGDEAAAALAVDPHRIFKTLIAAVDGRLACAVVPVAGRLDTKALAGALGGKRAELAEAAAATRATGYVLGGISPLGQRTRLRTVVDVSAERYETIMVSAGRRGLQVELAPTALREATGALSAAITVHS